MQADTNEVVKPRSLDISEFNADNIGVWPLQYRALVCVLLFVTVLAVGYFLHVKELYSNLDRVAVEEKSLRDAYQQKAFEAANLDAYRQQMAEVEESFGALLSQLPGDTEVPGLLEDITEVGYGSSLDIKSIDLQPENAEEFYIELPIKIVAEGGYHDIATFVSGVAGLPRIVTLHGFSIANAEDSNRQVFEVEAKTYRYKIQDE